MKKWEKLINRQKIIELYEKGIKKYTPVKSIDPPTEGCIEGSLGNAWSAHVYMSDEENDYSLIFVSHLLFYLANNHCFTDGNKRVGWLTAVEILEKYGISINATDDEAEKFMLGITAEKSKRKFKDGMEVASWLSKKLISTT